MGDDLDDVIAILEASVRRNGEQPLTNRWLLNILRMVQRHQNEDSEGPPGVSGEEFWKD